MTDIQTAAIEKIKQAWAPLFFVRSGRVDQSLLTCGKLIREIGALLEVLMGKTWSPAKYREYDGLLPFDFHIAKLCFELEIKTPNGITLKEAARYSELIFEVMGNKQVKTCRKAQYEAPPAVVIYNALETARVTVERRMRGKPEWNKETDEAVKKAMSAHFEWAKKMA
jgi:hypothetical protein